MVSVVYLIRDATSATQTYSEVVTRTRQYVLDNPDVLSDTTRWIVGVGWDQNLWADQSYPLAVSRVHFELMHCGLNRSICGLAPRVS
jgi:hypothetical protein